MLTREEMKMAESKIASCSLSEDQSDSLYDAVISGDVQKVGIILYGKNESQGVNHEV